MTPEVVSSAKADVTEFARRFGVVCGDLTEAQCQALKDTGILLALTRTLILLRTGQLGLNALARFVYAVQQAFSSWSEPAPPLR